jgi:steroid delta-isomerase-like uncharacterized protein
VTNVALVQLLHQLWNRGDLDLVERIYAPDFVAHWPGSSEMPERRGHDGVRFGLNRIRTAFPDWHEEVLDIFGAGDRVVTRYRSTGTHLGPFWDIPPSGRRIVIDEISIYRCADGRVAEQWCLCDELARLQQLGVTEIKRPG